jgi:hypothetical protein
MPKPRAPPWRRDPTQPASGKPGAVQPLSWRKAVLTLGDHLPCDPERIPVEILVLDQQFQESLLGFHLGFLFVGGVNAIVDAHWMLWCLGLRARAGAPDHGAQELIKHR